MSVRLTGVLEEDPRPCAGGTTTLTLAAAAQLFTVLVSSKHGAWVASTCSAGLLVEVTGRRRSGLIEAWRVRPVVELVD